MSILERYNQASKFIQSIAITLCFIVVFIIVYAPIIQTAYLFQDDWGYFIPGGRSLEFWIDYQLRQGRELLGLFMYILSNLFQSIEFSKTIRLIGILGLALFAFVTYHILKRCRFRSDHAFLMSTLICVLPSSQIIVSWAVCMPYIYSASMSSLAAVICFNIAYKKIDKGRKYRIIGISTAIILLISALNIYQPSAMTYWTMGIIFFLSMDTRDFSKKESLRFITTYFAVCLISMVIYYFVFIKLMPAYFNSNITRSGLKALSDPVLTLKWFISRPLNYAMNLWFLNPNKNIALFISAIICVGIIANISREHKEKLNNSARHYFVKYFLISILVILSFLPNLVTHSGHSYRFMIALSPALSILFCFALINIVEFFSFIPKFMPKTRNMVITALFAILTLVASFSAHNNVKKFAKLHGGEFAYVKNTLKDYGVDNLLRTSEIYVRRARYVPVPIEYKQNEFLSTIITQVESDWITPKHYSMRGIEQGEIGGGMVRYVIKLALNDIGFKQDIQITQGAPDDPVPEDKNVLVVDMVKFQSMLDLP